MGKNLQSRITNLIFGLGWLTASTALVALTSCGGTAGRGASSFLNSLTRTGQVLTIDQLVADIGTSGVTPASTSQQYYGRALIKNGFNLYGATFRMTLNKDSSINAYFSNFQILRLVILSGFNNAVPVVTSTLTVNVPTGYSGSTNALTIRDGALRTANFNLDFLSNTYLSDVTSAGIVVSHDFRTIVGGDDGNFFFIAQKASSLESSALQDFTQIFTLIDFSVSSSGGLSFRDLWNFSSAGGGGRGYEAYRMTTPEGSVKEGEFALVDSSSGVFVFGIDATTGDGTPTSAGRLDGVMLLSPDKQLMLSYDLTNGSYWAGSR